MLLPIRQIDHGTDRIVLSNALEALYSYLYHGLRPVELYVGGNSGDNKSSGPDVIARLCVVHSTGYCCVISKFQPGQIIFGQFWENMGTRLNLLVPRSFVNDTWNLDIRALHENPMGCISNFVESGPISNTVDA